MPQVIADPADMLKSLELLFDYTKFHIGAYLTLASSYVAVASLKRGENFVLPVHRGLALVAMLLFMLAGLSGGIVVSSITQCYGLPECSSTTEFLKQPMGPGQGEWVSLPGGSWVALEHTSFWVGLGVALLSFYLPSGESPRVADRIKLMARRVTLRTSYTRRR